MARVEGPIVAALNAVFATDWYTETDEILADELDAVPPAMPATGDVACQVVPSGPGFVAENNLRLFTTLIYSAQRRISMTSPYFVPDESLLYAVTTAAQRGVEVELFVSEEGDQFMVDHAQCSYYRRCSRPASGSTSTRRRTSCTPSTSPSTTTSRCSGRATWTCARSALNYEVSLMMLGPRHREPDARGRGRLPGAVARADPRGVGGAVPARRRTSTT